MEERRGSVSGGWFLADDDGPLLESSSHVKTRVFPHFLSIQVVHQPEAHLIFLSYYFHYELVIQTKLKTLKESSSSSASAFPSGKMNRAGFLFFIFSCCFFSPLIEIHLNGTRVCVFFPQYFL